MHLLDADAGMLLSEPIVGSSIPVGVGAALGFQQQQRDCVAVVYLGDASLEEGVFHESANFAVLRRLPVVFVCENNLYSVYTHISERQPGRSIEAVAQGHGVPSTCLDGNDAEAVRDAAAAAIRRARAGDGPSFLLCDTYRWREHCGPNYDNDIGYRTEAEFRQWQARDPIARLRHRLVSTGAVGGDFERDVAAAIRREIDDAFAAANAAPFPTVESLGIGVYA